LWVSEFHLLLEGPSTMTDPDLKRRDFSKLTLAALGGLVSGTVIGCSDDTATTKPAASGTGGAGSEGKAPKHDAAGKPETQEVAAHACRGLNDCKSAANECRGQGSCATKEWYHDCSGMNNCKGQGGCGDNPITNDCKGKGGCHVPLMEESWDKARTTMEAKWKTADQAFGTAPAKKAG
jgi:hypothetical protein